MSLPFISANPQFRTNIATVSDVLGMPAFNAMYGLSDAGAAAANLCDPTLGTAFIKNLVRDIRYGGTPIEINFFRDAFKTTFVNGGNDTMVETTDIYNHYTTDIDYNVVFDASQQGTTAGGQLWVRLIRAQHSGNGSLSYPTQGYSIIDKDNNITYQIVDEDKTVDYAHRFLLQPWDGDVVPSIKGGTKYFVNPAMIVDGCSCPTPTNAIQSIGYVQLVRPFRLRRDWKLCIELMRAYQNIFRFRTMFGIDGTPYDSWDTYEAQRMRDDLKIALNAVAMFATPITNPALLAGAGVVTDSRHTGFYGFLPTLEASSNVLDFDPAEGINFRTDIEPFMLSQDSLKRTNHFMVLHGKKFKVGLMSQLNDMIRFDGLGTCTFDAYSRNGNDGNELITRYGIDAFKDRALNYQLDFKELSPLSDYRFIGNDKLNSLAVFLAVEGVVDAKTNQPTSPVEFFQYGMSRTGGYQESIINDWQITGCETISGNSVESIMMAVHAPEMHAIALPESYC